MFSSSLPYIPALFFRNCYKLYARTMFSLLLHIITAQYVFLIPTNSIHALCYPYHFIFYDALSFLNRYKLYARTKFSLWLHITRHAMFS